MGVRVGSAVGIGVGASVGADVAVGSGVGVTVGLGCAVTVSSGVKEVGDGAGIAVGSGVSVGARVGVGVELGMCLAVGVGVGSSCEAALGDANIGTGEATCSASLSCPQASADAAKARQAASPKVRATNRDCFPIFIFDTPTTFWQKAPLTYPRSWVSPLTEIRQRGVFQTDRRTPQRSCRKLPRTPAARWSRVGSTCSSS